jgi:hypothetical protein
MGLENDRIGLLAMQKICRELLRGQVGRNAISVVLKH